MFFGIKLETAIVIEFRFNSPSNKILEMSNARGLAKSLILLLTRQILIKLVESKNFGENYCEYFCNSLSFKQKGENKDSPNNRVT